MRTALRTAGFLCIIVAFAIGFIQMPNVWADTPPPPELSLRSPAESPDADSTPPAAPAPNPSPSAAPAAIPAPVAAVSPVVVASPVTGEAPAVQAAPAATAAPVSTVPRCPTGGTTAVSVDLTQGYQTFHDPKPGPACRLDFVRAFGPRDLTAPALTVSPDVTVSFTGDGLEADFTITQPTILKTVRFDGVTLEPDDNVALFIRKRGAAKNLLTAYVNANGKCSSVSSVPGNITRHKQCQAGKATITGTGWSSHLLITYDVLGQDRIPLDFLVRAQVTYHPPPVRASRTEKYLSGDPAVPQKDPKLFANDQFVGAAMAATESVAGEQYVSAAPNLGNSDPALPPHRTSTLVNVPLSAHDFVSATFSDDTGALLNKRDKALGDILPSDQADALSCISCGSFQSDHSTPFDRLVTSKDTLGFDFGQLGVDSVPFSFDAAGYALDAGFKALIADERIALATLSGTTDNDGAARDAVLRLSRQFDWGTNTFRAGFYHAVATRSNPAPIPADTYVPGGPGVAHTQTSEASFGFSHAFVPSAINDTRVSTAAVKTVSALVRLGTEHAGPDANRVEAAASLIIDPAFADFKRVPTSLPQWGVAVGYRSLGQNYLPLDGDFDPLVGLHGFYGKALYSEPTKTRVGPSGASLSIRRFSDAAQARDVAVTGSISDRLDSGDHFSLTGSFTTGSLSVSQAGRQLSDRITVRDDQLGGTMLPNTSRSGSFTYKNASFFQSSVGYTTGTFQNCDPTLPAPPCFSYRQSKLTGSLVAFPLSDVFVAGAIKNLNDEGLQLIGNPIAAQGALRQSTAGHIVHQIAAGAYLFHGKCSTLTYTTEDRGGSGSSFAKGVPAPGFTNVASLELQPTKTSPALLMAYVRQSGTPATQFFVRLRFGAPVNAYINDVKSNCDNR